MLFNLWLGMSGGSFINGAVSGAFIQMFNHDGDHSDVSGESTLDKIQTGLDYAGFINPLADVANAGIYALRGDFAMAGLNLIAAVPVVGDGIKVAYKVEKFASKTGTEITKHAAERMAERGITKKMVDTGISKGTKYFDPKNGTFNYVLEKGFASGKDLLIGVSPQTGKVTTVLRGNNLVNKRFIPQ